MKKQKTSEKTQDKAAQVAVFAAALRQALGTHAMSHAELARRINRSPSAISNYTIGRDAPGPETVFAIEQALGLAGGYLSRLLGFCPCESGHDPPGFEEAVLADPALPVEHKKTLIGLYKGLAVATVER